MGLDSTDAGMDGFVARGIQILQSPPIRDALSAVRRVTGYELSKAAREAFVVFHAYITSEPPPAYITTWRTTPTLEHWYKTHVDGVLHSAQNALAAAYYHRDKICEIETEMISVLEEIDFKSAISKLSTVGVGGTLKLDFEYQAFILAARRCLEYMTHGLAAYFRQNFASFRRMPKSLRNIKSPVSESLMKTHAAHLDALGFLLSRGRVKSTRDKISHDFHIDAGCLNLTPDGFVLVGGGENLNLGTRPADATRLSQVIDERLAALQLCVGDHIQAFVNAASEEQRSTRALH